MIIVVPMVPDTDGTIGEPTQLYGRKCALDIILDAGGDRVAVYGLVNAAGLPIYVHSKVCIIDDRWASVGSDNFNRRSWSSDSELACTVVDERAEGDDEVARDAFAPALRRELVAEHLGQDLDEVPDDPVELFDVMRASTAALDNWYATGGPPSRRRALGAPGGKRVGPGAAGGVADGSGRPPGQLRRLAPPILSRGAMLWAPRLYTLFDPDDSAGADRELG